MPDLILYLLKANVALLLFYLAYYLVLRKLTFYHLNRLFLVFGLVFSALFPFLDLTELFNRHQELAAMQSYAVVLPAWAPPAIPEQTVAFDYWLIPVALFWAGCGFMAVRLALQFVSLYKIHRASVPASYQGVDFRRVSGITEAFSFWKTIYLNPAQHRSPELESILRHEQIHVNGWHTLDVLLAELSTVFYWFNPGVWLMKKALKENLEFIADQHVVDAGVDRKEYQYLLLKVVGATQPQIANQFNFPSLKRRIAMMNKPPTKKANRLRLLVVLPIATFLLLAFRSVTQESGLISDASLSSDQFLTPAAGMQAEVLAQDTAHLPADYKAFLKRNPSVKQVQWISNNTDKIVIYLKAGGTEIYDLGNSGSVKIARSKYGELPSMPPPPPPPVPAKEQLPPPPPAPEEPKTPPVPAKEQSPPPPPPVKGDSDEAYSYILGVSDEYYKDEVNLPKDHKAFLKKNPDVKHVGYTFNNRKEYDLLSFVVYLKSGKTEVYHYNRNPRIPAAEAKYGQLPDLPPPPPPVSTAKK